MFDDVPAVDKFKYDYHATLKVTNGRLHKAMTDCGYRNVARLSKASGVSLNSIHGLMNFKISPLNKKGEWRKPVCTLCKFLGYSPEDIFPEHLLHTVESNSVAKLIDAEALQASNNLLNAPKDPYESIKREEDLKELEDVLNTLSPPEQRILRGWFFEEKTFDELGKEEGFTKQRSKQIAKDGLRRMRHPSRLRRLEPLFKKDALIEG